MRAARIDTVPGLMEEVAEAYAAGATQEEIAGIAGVKDRGTIADWLKRADVQLLVQKKVAERASSILRHTDTGIQKILESGKRLSLEQLLKIRREFAGQQVKLDLGGDKASATAELLQALFADPDLAARFREQVGSDAEPDPD